MTKLCIIGAGSTEFTKRIVTDLFLMKEFRSIELSLMDIDAERLRVSEFVIKSIAEQLNVKPIISSYLNRREALKGADFVQTTIQVGGYKPSTLIDFDIPKKFGLRQTIADTLGIGGIMRGLRTIPVLESICKDILDVCPNAIWLQYVNPMAMNMMAIDRISSDIKAIGLCHSVQGTAEMLANDLNENIKDISFSCAGINHMAFYTKFEKILKDGSKEDLYPRLKKIAKKVVNGEHTSSRSKNAEIHGRALSEKVRYEMLLRLGFFVTESSEHFSEYVPWFIKPGRKDLIEKFEIPLDEYIDRCEASISIWENHEKALNKESEIITYPSNEYASEIIKANVTNNSILINGNVPNSSSLVPNLPKEACVEVPCKINGRGIFPIKVDALPIHLTALMQTNINVQNLTVEAIMTKKREHVYHAAMLDPITSSQLTIDEIWSLVDQMIEAHGKFIPELF